MISVVIIDDDRSFCDGLFDFLKHVKDIEIIGIAYDGETGLSKIINLRPSVALLDLSMPKLDGLSVLEKLKNLDIDTKIIISTINNNIHITNVCYSLGACYVLLKPYDFACLPKLFHTLSNTKLCRQNGKIAIRDYLTDLGIPTDKVGFYFLTDAVAYLSHNDIQTASLTKDIYPFVANKNKTSPANVERGLRYIVDFLWNRSDEVFLEKIYGRAFKKNRPTNGEFIFRIYEKTRVICDL